MIDNAGNLSLRPEGDVQKNLHRLGYISPRLITAPAALRSHEPRPEFGLVHPALATQLTYLIVHKSFELHDPITRGRCSRFNAISVCPQGPRRCIENVRRGAPLVATSVNRMVEQTIRITRRACLGSWSRRLKQVRGPQCDRVIKRMMSLQPLRLKGELDRRAIELQEPLIEAVRPQVHAVCKKAFEGRLVMPEAIRVDHRRTAERVDPGSDGPPDPRIGRSPLQRAQERQDYLSNEGRAVLDRPALCGRRQLA